MKRKFTIVSNAIITFTKLLFAVLAFCITVSCEKDNFALITFELDDLHAMDSYVNPLSTGSDGNYSLSFDRIRAVSLVISGGDGEGYIIGENKNIEIVANGNKLTITPKNIVSYITITISDKSGYSTILSVRYVPIFSNAPVVDTYIDGGELSDEEKTALRKEILAEAFTGFDIIENGADAKLQFFYNNSSRDLVEYDAIRSPKDEDITSEQMENIAWTQNLQLQYWYLLRLESKITAVYITTQYTATKTSPVTRPYFHLDVTAKFKAKYPKLVRAYSVHHVI